MKSEQTRTLPGLLRRFRLTLARPTPVQRPRRHVPVNNRKDYRNAARRIFVAFNPLGARPSPSLIFVNVPGGHIVNDNQTSRGRIEGGGVNNDAKIRPGEYLFSNSTRATRQTYIHTW